MKTSAAYEILTGGHGGDAPTASGGQINLVTKSGSNRFEGELNATLDAPGCAFSSIRAKPGTRASSIRSTPWSRGRSSAIGSGTSSTWRPSSSRTGAASIPSGLFPARPDGLNYNNKGMVKLTWQATTRNRLSTIFNFDSPHERNRKGDLGVEPEAQERRIARRMFGGVIWDSLLRDDLVLRSQAGVIYLRQPRLSGDVHLRARPVRLRRADHPDAARPPGEPEQRRPQPRRRPRHPVQQPARVVPLERPPGRTRHPARQQLLHRAEHQLHLDPRRRQHDLQRDQPGHPDHLLLERSPARRGPLRLVHHRHQLAAAHRHPARPVAAHPPPDGHRVPFPRLGPGINSAGDTAISNAGLVPSVSAAWDATHDGRTVLRTSFSNYADLEIEDAVRHSLGGRVSYLCRWNESSQRFDSNCEYSGGASGNTIGRPCGSTGIDANGNSCIEKLRIPRTQEYTLGAEREVTQGVAISLDGMYRALQQPVRHARDQPDLEPGRDRAGLHPGLPQRPQPDRVGLRHARLRPAPLHGHDPRRAQARGPLQDSGVLHAQPAQGDRGQLQRQPRPGRLPLRLPGRRPPARDQVARAIFGDQLAVDRDPLRTTARASPTTACSATRSPTRSRTTGPPWASTRAPTSTTPATTASCACPTCRA